MPYQDTNKIKEKIISIIRLKGPSLPIHISKEIGFNSLFTSAFLSELYSEKKLKISNLKVGSSPLYFIPGQESRLQNFSEHLKSKEKEAFLVLKEKKFLKDSEVEPALRVALRSIKDFAIPFEKSGNLFWRYFSIPESEFHKKEEEQKDEIQILRVENQIAKSKKDSLIIFDEKKEDKKPRKKTKKKKTTENKTRQSQKFLEKVKNYLKKSSIDILSIEGMKKDELILKVKKEGNEELLVAFNKKRISDKEIIKASKKASELNLKFSVLSLGHPQKKITDLFNALQNIKSIEKVE